MFDRSKYKRIAKKQLKGRWGLAIVAVLISLAVAFIFNIKINSSYSGWFNNFFTGFFTKNPQDVTVSAPPMATKKNMFIFVLIEVFICSVVYFAKTYLFVVYSHTVEKQSFNTYVKGYSFWLQAFLGYLWNYLWVFLWSLLLVIPGIIKSISYSMIYYILAEYPDIGVRKAMKLSKEMTRGHKADLFVLGLSFIGWLLLTLITAGIAGLYVMPYIEMTFINAYHDIKQDAFTRGILSPEDFSTNQED